MDGTEQGEAINEENPEIPSKNAGKSGFHERRDRDSNPGYPCGYSGFQDRTPESLTNSDSNNLRKSQQVIAAPIAAPNGHDLATNDNLCHLPADLGRVVEAWPKLSAEARLMIMALVSAAESSLAREPE